MPLLSYEGVEVDIPTSLTGIQFTFTNGALTIQCTNFTGDVVLSKPVAAAAPQPTASPARPATANSATAPSKKRSLKSRNIVEDNNDGDDDDDDDDSESSASSKRVRPNFLNDVEQSILLAQLQTVSQSSKASTKREDADSIMSSSGASLTDKEPSRSSTASSKTTAPVRASAASAKASTPAKKSTATVQTTLFSPDAGKPLTARKATPESQKKRSRPPKASAASSGPTAAPTAASTKSPVRGEWQVVPTQGNAPVERWGDSATKIANDRVVVYGGADDDEQTLGSVHVFDLNTHTWSEPLNCTSLPRAWHDAVYLASKHLLLVFGGERFMGDDQTDVLADIMVLDTECFLWYPPAVSGVAPAARSGHSCTVVGDDVVVFGGSRGRNRQSTVHVLNSNTWHWTPVKVDGKPPTARTYHSAVAVGDSVVYFGGNDAKKSFNSVHVLLKKSSGAWSWFHPCVVGTPPQARTGHSATLIDGTKILVFGGWDPQREGLSDADPAAPGVFSDAFVLDTETWEWTPVAISSSGDAASPLPGRVGHRAVLDAHNNVVVFGGQNSSDKRLNVVHSIALQLGGVQEQPEPEASTTALQQ